MVTLTGENLGKRQQEFNAKVNETINKKTKFDDIEGADENTDIDKLFKIDVASKYKNVDYIVEILKSGDSLYVSRALKSIWLYNDEYSYVINPDYLQRNVFPMMSLKLKKKLLCTIAMYIKNEDRAASFFNYCLNTKMIKIALKFLILTYEDFKYYIISYNIGLIDNEDAYLRHLIRDSFRLADAYLAKINVLKKNWTLHVLRYLYSVSNEAYLNIFEAHFNLDCSMSHYNTRKQTFGLRLSKDIMKKYKSRLLNNIHIYIQRINKNTMVKYLTVDDAKYILRKLMPEKENDFWSRSFCKTNKYLIDLIPKNEIFEFLKSIFKSKYPEVPFEMSFKFYDKECFTFMTVEEQEQWALRHLESGIEMFGKGENYQWYGFVDYDKAIAPIKKYIVITPDKDKRSNIVKTLVKSARNQGDLEKLFSYYYERHVNESAYHKDDFLSEVVEMHDVFSFDQSCWAAFSKILYSLEIHTPGYDFGDHLRTLVLIYGILNDDTLHDASISYMDRGVNFDYIDEFIKQLSSEKADAVYQYLLKYFIAKVDSFTDKVYDDDVKLAARNYISQTLNLLYTYDKTEEDCPKIIVEYAHRDWDSFKYQRIFSKSNSTKALTEGVFLRLLKQDASRVIEKLPDVKDKRDDSFRLTNLLKKMKIYFANDKAKECVNFFLKCLTDTSNSYRYHRIVRMAIFSLFQVGDEKVKIDLMTKYAPKEAKIDHSNIDRNVLHIQKAICRFAGKTRPPVPLSNMLSYIKGDYVQYCLPIFNMYLVNLPLPSSMAFVESILDAPLSLQKHGIRLAFKCFSIENLKKLIENVWTKSKNVSLRMIIYKELVNKLNKEDIAEQNQLFETVLKFTSTLHEEDHDDVFAVIRRNAIPERLRGPFLEEAWNTLQKLGEKSGNYSIKADVILAIENNIDKMNRDYVRCIVDEHVHEILTDHAIKPFRYIYEITFLHIRKRDLAARYIVESKDLKELDESLELLKSILNKAVNIFDIVREDQYSIRYFIFNLIEKIKSESHFLNRDCAYTLPVFECILEFLNNSIRREETYLAIWDLKLMIALRTIISGAKSGNDDQSGDDTESEDNVSGEEGFKHLDAEEVGTHFGEEVGNIVSDLVKKNSFYCSLYSNMTEKLSAIAYTLSKLLGTEKENIVLYMSKGLTDIKIVETHMLALMILPTDVSDDEIMQKIMCFNSTEVKSFVYNKYVHSDFKKRKFI